MRALTVLVLFLSGVALAWTATSGNITMSEADVARARAALKTVPSDIELLVNGDFESGELTPWTTNAWVVSTKYPHGGTYCASDIGNYYIEQQFTSTPGNEVLGVTFWMRQPETAISQCRIYYDDATFDYIVAYPDTSWTLVDMTGTVNPSKNVVGLRIYGYSGGGPDPDSSFLDDASIEVEGTGVLEPVRVEEVRPAALTVSPNPVRGDFVNLGYVLPQAGPVEVTVLNIAGRGVLRRGLAVQRSGSARLDVRDLEPGVYLVRLEAAGSAAGARLVRQR